MTAPLEYGHPIKRAAGYLRNARFEGDDDRLYFRVDYPKLDGNLATMEFRLFTDGTDYQEMCIPAANYDITKIDRDTLVAHIRMASIISDTTPTSVEWLAAMQIDSSGLINQTKYFQTVVSSVRISDVALLNDNDFQVELQRGTTSNKKTIAVGYNEVSKEGYVYTPQTQLKVIPGAVLKEFSGSSHRHSYPGDILTNTERTEIINFVNSLELWV